MTDLTNFAFDENLVRVLTREGDPWFVAADVARVLGIGRTEDAVRRLDDDEKGADTIRTPGGNQTVTIINESGLYSLVLTSRKPEAKRFKKWITSEVLPSIRKTGSYSIAEEEKPQEQEFGSLQEMRLKFDIQKEARILFGPAVARQMWAQMGFPDPLGAAGIKPPTNGAECLKSILEYSLEDGVTVADHIAVAFAANDLLYLPLIQIGIRICVQPEAGIFIATNATYLRPILGGTEWSNGLHSAALRGMPGASVGKTMKFGKHAVYTTFLPIWLLKTE